MKKVLSVLLCLVLCFNGISALAYYDYPDVEEEYIHITDLLYDLEIMEGDDKGNFNPHDTLTRAEAAVIMVRLLGKYNNWLLPSTIFSDVPRTHWAARYIYCAYENGIISGMGDGTFEPDDPLTYHQAVKMLVCLLGYGPVAEVNGGFNGGGYLYTGSKQVTNIIKGVENWISEKRYNEPITRMAMAQMVYNALDVELMDENSFSMGITGTICDPPEGETILTKYLHCQRFEGYVTNFYEKESRIQIVIKDCDYSPIGGDLKIGQRRELLNCDRNAKSFLGYKISGYFKEGKFLKGSSTYHNETFTLSGSDIKDFTKEKVVYYKDKATHWVDEFELENYIGIIYFVPIELECNVIVNGMLNPDFDIYKNYKNLDKITFIDNDHDSAFEFIIVNTEE